MNACRNAVDEETDRSWNVRLFVEICGKTNKQERTRKRIQEARCLTGRMQTMGTNSRGHEAMRIPK